MNRHHIKAVMYKQFCDTLKNKLLLLLIFMYPVLAYIFYFLLKDTQEAVNIVIPIFITMHIIMAPIVCMSSIISEEKEKNTIKVLLFSGIRRRRLRWMLAKLSLRLSRRELLRKDSALRAQASAASILRQA